MNLDDARAPLCLVGMSGIGKSFWAKRLVDAGWTRHDCDGDIAARLSELVTPDEGEEPVRALGRWMGMPYSSGYDAREARYLALEEEVTRRGCDAATGARHVIDCTGSVVYLSPALRERLARATRVVYLATPEARTQAMLARYLAEPKPVVWGGAYARRAGEDERAALSRSYGELLRARDLKYRALAHVTLDGGELEARAPSLDAFVAACGVER